MEIRTYSEKDNSLNVKILPKGDVNLVLSETKGNYISLTGKYIKGSPSGGASDAEAPLRMEIITDGYQTMAFGETLHIECKVFRGWTDVTKNVISWKVERRTYDEVADLYWGYQPKAKYFKGTIDIVWNSEENDLGDDYNGNNSTIFIFTAEFSNSKKLEATIEI